jgi:hypothetical protein
MTNRMEVTKMRIRRTPRIIVLALLTLILAVMAGITIFAWRLPGRKNLQKHSGASSGFVVHEWGTFTSIAGKDGVALEWRPLNGPTDLPKFVHTIQNEAGGLRHAYSKADQAASIRMETPVLYFYSPSELEASVKVDFPRGKITEWYPQARSVNTSIDWGRVKVIPGATMNLPAEYSASHYYAARETDSAAVQVCTTNGKPPQQEKFLFYRGVGTFDLPISVRLDGDSIVLKNSGTDDIAHLIVFENRSGKVGYSSIDNFTGERTIKRPSVDQNIDSVLVDLKQALTSAGLYEKEADAMLKTWRDSWFEPGLRVFYILPRPTTDAVLPISIEPRPAELVRVLVGRAEIITPEMEKSVQKQVSLLGSSSPQIREAAMGEIKKYGRFSEPILKQLLETEKREVVRQRIKELIESRPKLSAG